MGGCDLRMGGGGLRMGGCDLRMGGGGLRMGGCDLRMGGGGLRVGGGARLPGAHGGLGMAAGKTQCSI